MADFFLSRQIKFIILVAGGLVVASCQSSSVDRAAPAASSSAEAGLRPAEPAQTSPAPAASASGSLVAGNTFRMSNGDTLTFAADNTYRVSNGNLQIFGTWRANGKRTCIKTTGKERCGSMTRSSSGYRWKRRGGNWSAQLINDQPVASVSHTIEGDVALSPQESASYLSGKTFQTGRRWTMTVNGDGTGFSRSGRAKHAFTYAATDSSLCFQFRVSGRQCGAVVVNNGRHYLALPNFRTRLGG